MLGAFLVAIAGGLVPALAAEPVSDDPVGSAQLLVLANLERSAAGLAPLELRNDVTEIATEHSRRMAASDELFHNDDYFSASVRSRLGARTLGENVAMNRSADDAHRRLMLSPDHRANLMNPKFTVVGMAMARSADGMGFVTQDFVEPAVARAVPTVVPAELSPPPAEDPAPPPAPAPAASPAPSAAVAAPAVPAASAPAGGPPPAVVEEEGAAGAEQPATTTTAKTVSVVTEPISSSPTSAGRTAAVRSSGPPTVLVGALALVLLVLVAVSTRRQLGR